MTELVTAVRTRFVLLAPRVSDVSFLLSSSFLSLALPLHCDEKQNQPSVSVCGF